MRKINDIIIHCTATEAGRDYTLEEITKWHRSRGFKEVGYHYIIHPDGRIEKGRPLSMVGAHCQGHNANSVGIAYVGGLRNGKPADTRTIEQKEALAKLIWRITYRVMMDDQGICEVHGHHDYNRAKACPCFDARSEYN